MKIERISDNQIRCTLNKEDLKGKETLLNELAFGSDKAKGLFRELMKKASAELGFETNDIPPEHIHISEEDDLLDFLNGQTDSPLKDFEESMKFALADSTMNIYYFNTLEEVAAAARLIRNYETRSSLYKDPDSHYYYLTLSSVSNDASDSVMEEIHSILAEYCRRLPNTYATKSLFNEHLKPLIQARAVEEMSQY